MSATLPKHVLIIRHGEKLGDPKTDQQGGPDLSIRGSARAAALPSLFVPATTALSCLVSYTGSGATALVTGQYKPVSITGAKPRFETPDVIFATEVSSASNRPVETVTPTAVALGLSVVSKGYPNSKDGIEALVAQINSGKFAGKVVLICWHHGKIPDLAGKLGVAKPPSWEGMIFDRVWKITYSKDGKATFHDHPQQLLYGDSAN